MTHRSMPITWRKKLASYFHATIIGIFFDKKLVKFITTLNKKKRFITAV